MINAAAWYESQQPDLGKRFLTVVQDATNRIAINPLLFPEVEGDVRRCLLNRRATSARSMIRFSATAAGRNVAASLAVMAEVDVVVNGGDMLPKADDLHAQGKFITGYLSHHFAEMDAAGIQYLCYLGNDDLAAFDDLFDRTCRKYPPVTNLAQRKVTISGHDFIGMNWTNAGQGSGSGPWPSRASWLTHNRSTPCTVTSMNPLRSVAGGMPPSATPPAFNPARTRPSPT